MPVLLQAVKHWLKILLDLHTPIKQAKYLLKTASPPQLLALKEIFYNLVHNKDIITLRPKNQKLNIRRWERLSQKKNLKSKHLSKYVLSILKLLHSYRDLILAILKNNE
jgi:hypothetical protein